MLFARGGRRLVLTPAGEQLLPWAQRVVDGVDGAHESLLALRGLTGGVASLGVLRNAAYYFLADLAERFHRDYPGVRTRLIGQNSFEVAEGVRSGELEAGLVVLPINDDGLDVTPLLRDEVLWVSADKSRCAAPMSMERIAERELILYDAHYGWNDPTRRQLAERAQLHGLRLDPLIEVENVESALGLVARGIGDTIVSKAVTLGAAFPADEVHTAPMEEPLYDTIALVKRANATLSPVTEELVRLATSMLLAPHQAGEAVSP